MADRSTRPRLSSDKGTPSTVWAVQSPSEYTIPLVQAFTNTGLSRRTSLYAAQLSMGMRQNNSVAVHPLDTSCSGDGEGVRKDVAVGFVVSSWRLDSALAHPRILVQPERTTWIQDAPLARGLSLGRLDDLLVRIHTPLTPACATFLLMVAFHEAHRGSKSLEHGRGRYGVKCGGVLRPATSL